MGLRRGDKGAGDLDRDDVVLVTTTEGGSAVEDDEMDNGNVERVLRMADGAGDAIRRRVEDLARIEGDLANLDGRTCTGVEYWRREAGKPDRLYLNHSIDQACPMHGQPAPGGRLRSYVGSDPDRIAAARAALEREKTRRDLEHEAQTIRHGLASCGYSLRQFYGTLGVRVGDDGRPW